MDKPEKESETYETVQLIGTGVAGKTFLARDPNGDPCVVKVLDALAVNARVLRFTFEKLAGLELHRGIAPILEYTLDESPMFFATPIYADIPEGAVLEDLSGKELPVSNSLLRLGQQLSKADKWRVIEDLAEAVGWLHRHGVPHSAITPGNIFLDPGDADCAIRLTDIALGWMRDLHHIDVFSFLPCIAPEQAISPEGIYEGSALGWDVYAFGTVTFWLLENRWPRGAEFLALAETARGTGASVDLQAYHDALIAEKSINWEKPAASEDEARCREVIEKSLSLDPTERFADVREILLDFERIGHQRAVENLEGALGGEQKNHAKTRWLSRAIAAGLAILLALLAFYAGRTRTRAVQAEDLRETDRAVLEGEVEERDGAIAELGSKLGRAQRHREEAYAELDKSSATIDILLGQILDPSRSGGTGARAHQVSLEDQEILATAKDHFEAKLKRETEGSFDRARTILRLARIEEALANTPAALDRYEATVGALRLFLEREPDHPGVLPARERLAQSLRACHHLYLASDRSEDGASALREAASIARQLAEMPEAQSSWKEECVLCELEVSRALAESGQAEEAIERIGGVADLADAGLLQSEVLLCEAGLQEILGHHEEAVQCHMRGIDSVSGADMEEGVHRNRLLAEHYTALAEFLALRGDAEGTRTSAQAAEMFLDKLRQSAPDAPRPMDLFARTQGLGADLERDEGNRNQALLHAEAALDFHRSALGVAPSEPRFMSGFLRSIARAANLFTDTGKDSEAIALLEEGESQASRLLETDRVSVAGVRRVNSSRAEVLGQLGHLLEEAGDKGRARVMFESAASIWNDLAETTHGDEAKSNFADQAAWAQERSSRIGG